MLNFSSAVQSRRFLLVIALHLLGCHYDTPFRDLGEVQKPSLSLEARFSHFVLGKTIPSCHLSVKCGAMSHINATPTTILLVEDATGSYDIDAATEKALEKLPVL